MDSRNHSRITNGNAKRTRSIGAILSRFNELRDNLEYLYAEDGIYAVKDRLVHHAGVAANKLKGKIKPTRPRDDSSDFVDVLFVNGCDYCVPHPIRYRVEHQAEQLEAAGMSTRIVNAWELNDDYARMARTFIVFRCPYSDFVGNFIDLVHSLNKKVLFDIDDLVIDTVYTDQIPYLGTMSPEERAQYDEGVRLMGKTMQMCDGAITTTDQLAAELRNYVNPVFVNRNVASKEMQFFSEKARFERDILPDMPESEIAPQDKHRWKLARQRKNERTGFHIGYFSGSITHNDDFALILPSVVRFMSDYGDVYLHVVGELDLPEELKPFENRIVRLPFSPWRHLPKMVASVDVNLIPLADTVFNRAKSENKWVEAGLVKVASIASAVGALSDSITDDVDGVLCSKPEDWYDALVSLKLDGARRARIAQKAYDECTAHHTTLCTGMPLLDFIRAQETPNIAFVLPGLDISGGVLVAMKHAAILAARGIDVCLLAPDDRDKKPEDRHAAKWITEDARRIPVLLCGEASLRGRFDKMVATMWTTLDTAKLYENAAARYYLVQNLETGFYPLGSDTPYDAAKTYGYNPTFTYCTISPWCKSWLESDFGHDVRYAPNGIDLSLFKPQSRDWNGKIRILVEGDSSSDYKNVDESFRIIDLLDKERYEIWYLSYRGKPKDFYRVDKFLQAVPHNEVGEIYGQCHILLKTSILESFSYPPLEMMATGGISVVLRNEGNAAFLVDGENSLLFDRGEDEKAAALIDSLVEDATLRDRLTEGGFQTAQNLSWENITNSIEELYQ